MNLHQIDVGFFFVHKSVIPRTNIACRNIHAKCADACEPLPGKLIQAMMRYREIYEKTISKWGEAAQYDQTIEECAELIATLQHYARGKVDKDAVVNELADVFLMVGQLTYMFGEDLLSSAVEKKVAKLHLLLEEDVPAWRRADD